MKQKKFLWMSVALVALALAACGGQGGSKSESTKDSTSVAAVQDSAAVTANDQGDTQAAEATGTTATEAGAEADAKEAETKAAVLNTSLLGKYSNYNDPSINLTVSDKYGNYEDHKGYGIITTYNEYFEPELVLVVTSLTPDGDNIKVHYNKMEMEFEGGDPDDLGGEGQWVEKKTGSGDLTLSPAGAGKVKVSSKERRLNGVTLRK